jgi:hypothetical protein
VSHQAKVEILIHCTSTVHTPVNYAICRRQPRPLHHPKEEADRSPSQGVETLVGSRIASERGSGQLSSRLGNWLT